ncbi:MAG: enoyl-CoA hydratase/isomerase family protein [Proteobacteria bacterium]|nr:enoyl-CoA hydratase/isomerase family protein [Pseudomonadota bacterium]MBU4384741.1 enoyl-CoA hydratase/isomerase family protein [Pseudomonadota bacterium]MCG2764051.1 enoyl-CoA hydratase-related protein [Desulfarculaceae bacterium]
MDSQSVIFMAQGKIAQIVLNRPDRLNAIDHSLKLGLAAALDQLEKSKDLRVVVLRGEGRAFCAGGDLSAIQNRQGMGRPEDLVYSQSLLGRLLELDQIVIAAVHGHAMGAGFNLAMAADLVYAADDTQFSQAFVKVGLTPDWGGMYLLPLLAGPRRAKECFFFGERFDARRALSWGLVNAVFAPDRLLSEVMALADRLAAGPWSALRLAKRIVDRDAPQGLQAVFSAEVDAFRQCSASPDFAEGIAAFLEKRKPNFN